MEWLTLTIDGREVSVPKGTTVLEASGCKFVINSKNGQVIGVTAKSPANGRPLCLKGRIGSDLRFNPERTDMPFINQDGEFIQVTWQEFLGLGNIVEKINSLAE